LKCEVRCVNFDESEARFELFERGIKVLDLGFYSGDSIVLGSILVVFGLLYLYLFLSFKSIFKKLKKIIVLFTSN
jgi:hypothetical protein